MLLLAIESSAAAASAALCRGETPVGIYYQNCGLTHSRTLLPMIDALLRGCGVSVSEIEAVAVASGPGSFTGLRIGAATAKGLAWPSDLRCAGVSTLLAAAYGHTEQEGIILPVMDARRSQVYTAAFRCADGMITRLCEDRAASLDELSNEIGGMREPVLICGDGAHLLRQVCGGRVRIAPEHTCMQNAYGVALASAREGKFASAADLVPHYIRLPQAERERLEKEKSQKENP